jgi:hypothetical protein
MKKINLAVLTILISLSSASYAEDCKKCVLVREFNQENPSKYEFYEDYLKDKKEGKAEEIRYEDNWKDQKANTPALKANTSEVIKNTPVKANSPVKVTEKKPVEATQQQIDNNQQRDMAEDIKFEEETGISY